MGIPINRFNMEDMAGLAGQFGSMFGGGMSQTQGGEGLPTAGDFRASEDNGVDLLQPGQDPATRAALEAAARETALGERSGAVGQALVGQNIIGGRNLEQISGLQEGQAAFNESLGFSGLAGEGFGAFQQGVQGAACLLADPSSILNNPLIQAQLQQGIGAAEMGQAAGGNQLSGGALRELQTLGQTFAGTQIDEQFNRFKGLAGLGVSGMNIENQADQLALQGQQDFTNLGLAQVDLRSGLAQQELGVQMDLLGSRNAKRSQRKALVGAGIGLGVSQFGGGGMFGEGGRFAS